MGFRWRKRTKGKNGWLNFSYSPKNGLNASVSVKAGPFTWNSGNGKTTTRRITTNIGGGLHHVHHVKRSSNGKTTSPVRLPPTAPTKPWIPEDTATSLILLRYVAFFIALIYIYAWLF